MKRTVTILLLAVMLTQAFSKVFVLLDYQANKEFITKFLCINREKPQLHCNGKCYLMQKLKKAEQAENAAGQKEQKQKQDITLYFQPLAASQPALTRSNPSSFSFFCAGKTSGAHLAVFHPPQITG
ncbi:MAG: hypothetical protein ACO1OQ_03575 [Rufibacter sp.]